MQPGRETTRAEVAPRDTRGETQVRLTRQQADDRPFVREQGGVFCWVETGQARLRAAQGSFQLLPGEWIALTAEPGHAVVVEVDGNAVCVSIEPALQAKWFADPACPVFFMARGAISGRDVGRWPLLSQAAEAANDIRGLGECGAPADGWQHVMGNLQSSCRLLSEQCPGYSVHRRRQVFMRFQHALMVLQGSADRMIRIADLARACNFSFCYFSRVFQALYGLTPQRVAAQHRLERAHALVTATGLSIIDVAAECGFENPSSFARAFRARYGATASTIRVTASNRGTSAGPANARIRATGTREAAGTPATTNSIWRAAR